MLHIYAFLIILPSSNLLGWKLSFFIHGTHLAFHVEVSSTRLQYLNKNNINNRGIL
jgi:hypothetical protein